MASPKPTDLLHDAIEAARVALRDMDADQVPAKVRRVRASSERVLPPPLAASLVRVLGSDEFLREKALEAWPGERPPDGGPSLASYAFLERSDGWEAVVVTEAMALGERRGVASDRSLELERDSLAAEVGALKEKLRRERDEADRRRRELEQSLEAERAPNRTDRQAEQRLTEQLERERSEGAGREAALQDRISSLEAEQRRLQETARAERAARSELETASAAAPAPLPTDPFGLARSLDEMIAHAASLSTPSTAARAGEETGQTPIALDPSVAPDRAEAVDRVIGIGSVTVIVDGYNLGFLLAGLDAMLARALAIEASRRLATAAPAAEVSVVFDSTVDAVDGVRQGSRTGNFSVSYTSGETADDAIVARVCGGGTRAVVITNDRELRHRVEECGAAALWADALAEWSRRR